MNRYTIGGVAFSIREPLPGLDTDGFADIEIAASFGTASPDISPHAIRRVFGPGGLIGVIDSEDLQCWLPDIHHNPEDRAWQLRQLAPLVSSVLQRLVLHASAVETEAGVVGFIAGSGVGKSTLARFLSWKGYRPAADDLLPVRFVPAPVVPSADRHIPIVALLFLDRAPIRQTAITSLNELSALQLLVSNGFGEHGDDETWGFQFDSYHRLIKSVPCYSMTVPDDLGLLEDVAETVAAVSSELR